MATVPFDKLGGKLWYNGELVDWDAGRLHILSHGLHYASCVFEGERAYGGQIFKHQEHTDRLFSSAEILGMDIPYSNKELYDAGYDSLKAPGFQGCLCSCRRLARVGDDGHFGAADHHDTCGRGLLGTWGPTSTRRPAWPASSCSGPSTSARLRSARLFTPRRRGLYMICTVSKHEAEANAGFNDALMVDWRGYVAECTGANIFFVKDGALHTPIPDCFLDGITRQTVIELAKDRGIEVVERHIMPEEVADMQEVFIVGTAAEVTPINQIGDVHYQVGEVTRDLLTLYHNHVRGE